VEVLIRAIGPRQVEIIIPRIRPADVERFEHILSRSGMLEFRILANNRDHQAEIEKAKTEPNTTQWFDRNGSLVTKFVPIRPGEEKSFLSSEIYTRQRTIKDNTITEVLVVGDPYNVTGTYLAQAEAATDRRGQPCVNFTLNSTGAQLFGKLTGDHLPDEITGFTYKLGIIFDGELYSAPAIHSTIYNKGEITAGSFSKWEVQELVNLLNGGSLPATLSKEPVSRQVIDPPTWPEWLLWLAAVGFVLLMLQLFLVFAYGLPGLAAAAAWFLNALMVLSSFLFLRWAVTPASLLGLVFTLGLATLCNWFVCLSIHRSSRHGANPAIAIWNGYRRGLAPTIALQLCALIVGRFLYSFSYSQTRSIGSVLVLGCVPRSQF